MPADAGAARLTPVQIALARAIASAIVKKIRAQTAAAAQRPSDEALDHAS